MVSAGAPSPAGAGKTGAIDVMMIENNTRRGQRVQVRRVNPGVAVAAQIAKMKTTENQNKDFHVISVAEVVTLPSGSEVS